MPQHAGVDITRASEDRAHPPGAANPDTMRLHPETSRAPAIATLGEARLQTGDLPLAQGVAWERPSEFLIGARRAVLEDPFSRVLIASVDSGSVLLGTRTTPVHPRFLTSRDSAARPASTQARSASYPSLSSVSVAIAC